MLQKMKYHLIIQWVKLNPSTYQTIVHLSHLRGKQTKNIAN